MLRSIPKLLPPATALMLFSLTTGCRDAEDRTPEREGLYHDFGMLDLGTKATFEFKVPIPQTNRKSNLVLNPAFNGDCTCAYGTLVIKTGAVERAVLTLPETQRVIHEGDEVFLRLTIDTKDKEPANVARTMSRGRISFSHNTGSITRRSVVPIIFHYGIETPIVVSPVAHLNFGKLPVSGVHTQTLEITSNILGRALTLGEVHASPKSIEAELREEDGRTLLDVKITPTGRSEGAVPVMGLIAIPTGIDYYTDLKIPVSGSFVGDIEFQSSYHMDFGLFDFTEERTRQENITDHNVSRPAGFVTHSIVTTSNEVDISEHFDVKFQTLSGRKTRVIVKYMGTMGGIEMIGWLKLAKSDGTEPVAHLRISGHNTKR